MQGLFGARSGANHGPGTRRPSDPLSAWFSEGFSMPELQTLVFRKCCEVLIACIWELLDPGTILQAGCF